MNTASSFIPAIVGAEFFSFFIGIVLLIGSATEKEKTKRTYWFISLVGTTIIGCFSDAVSWALDGHSEFDLILYLTSLCSMIMTLVLVGVFISYLSEYANEIKPISFLQAKIAWIVVLIGLIIFCFASATGELFGFEDGAFVEKPLYSIYVIANAMAIVVGIVVIAKFRKMLTWQDQAAAYIYMLIPFASAMVELLIPGCSFTYPAITVSLLILYITLQSDRRKKLKNEETIANYQATHDGLTGLFNRTAYQDRVQLLKSKEGNSGVIYGDLNGLKYANDTYGHDAGDRLIVRYAEIFNGIFRMNDNYRISGDEFVSILENMPKETFDNRVKELEGILNEGNPPLASIGSAYGQSRDIDSLIKDAENDMYKMKEIIHKNYPNTRRVD